MDELIKLSERINVFIDKYAGISPNYDPEWDDKEDRFTSPDASMMETCSDFLGNGELPPFYCDSSWNSGGYVPYNSIEGRTEHDAIMVEITKLKK